MVLFVSCPSVSADEYTNVGDADWAFCSRIPGADQPVRPVSMLLSVHRYIRNRFVDIPVLTNDRKKEIG